MSDNALVKSDATTTVATVAADEVTYSGDSAQVQVIRFVHVTGSEGSKVVSEVVRLEDAAHTSGDPGIPMFVVRKDTATQLAGTDGDYTLLVTDASGRLHVNCGAVAAHDVTNAGTFAVQADVTKIGGNNVQAGNGATSTGTQRVTLANDSTGVIAAITTAVVPGTAAGHLGKAEDAAHSSGDTGVMVLAVRESTPTDLSAGNTNGDYEPLQVNANGQLWVIARGVQDSGGTDMTDTTAHAQRIMQVDSTGTAVPTAVAATTDAITAKLATDKIQNGLTAVTPKFAKIAAASSGNNTLVSAVASAKIRVLAYNFMANGTVNAKFQDGAGGTDLTGLKYCVANTGLVAPFNPVGWFETSVNTLLNVNLSGAVAIGGELVYVEI